MRGRWFLTIALTAVMLTACCPVTVGGTAQPAPSLKRQSLTGQNIKRVLLGHNTLSRIIKEPLNIDPRFPPRFGGREALQENRSARPVDCLGVAMMLQRSVYRTSKVDKVAAEAWRHAVSSSLLTAVKEAVVSLPTASDANALFARFSRDWQRCDGKTLLLPDDVLRLQGRVSSVRVTPSLLTATLSIGFASLSLASGSIPAGRAIGVRDNCLIEVEVDFFNASTESLPDSGVVRATAVDIAQRMLEKVSALH